MAGYILIAIIAAIVIACVVFFADAFRWKKDIAYTEETTRYRIGRFSMAVPKAMKRANQAANFRERLVSEEHWPKADTHEKARHALWEGALRKIREQEPDGTKRTFIIKTENLDAQAGRWCRGVLYYTDEYGREIIWKFLVDGGSVGAWIEIQDFPEDQESMFKGNMELARAYRTAEEAAKSNEDWFYLEYGAFALPYNGEPEEMGARFIEHPLGIDTFSINTETVYKIQAPGLIESLASLALTAFAWEIKVHRLRTGKRAAAGLKGEEILLRVSDKDGSELSFTWRYIGEKNSGNRPEITLDLNAEDMNRRKILDLWDAMVDSLEHAAAQNKRQMKQ